MADNVTLNSGSGGDTAAADDIGGVKHQRVKISVGVDGTANDAVPVSNGMDSTGTGTLSAGLVAQVDDTATGAVTENQFGPVRMSTRRALLVEGVASGTAQAVSVSGTVTVDGSGVTQPVSHAALTELAAAIDTELQVDVVGSLPAGANAIGKLAANSGVDIGDVDVTSVVPGSGATNLGKAEDAAHSSGDVGVMALAVRRDSAAASSGADGDYEPLSTDNAGQLRVTVGNTVTVGSHAITNAGTFAVQESGSALTALQLIDNIVLAEDAAHVSGDPGVQLLAVRKDSGAAIAGTDGDYSPLQVDASGSLRVTGGGGGTEYTEDVAAPADPVGATFMMTRDDQLSTVTEAEGDWSRPRSTSKGALWVALADSTGDPITSFGGGTQYTEDAAAAADPTGTAMILVRKDALAGLTSADGDNVAARGTDKGELYVKHVDSIPVTNAGTFAVQSTAVGTVADDATTPGNPVMVGGKAVETDGTDPTSVSAEDDVAIFRSDRNRRLLVNDFHPNHWSLFEDHTSAQTNNQLKAAPGANLSLYVTDVVVSNGATAGTIKLVEDESGTPAQISQTIYMAINGGAVIHWKTPKRLTANKTLGFTSATVTTHSIEVHGFIAP